MQARNEPRYHGVRLTTWLQRINAAGAMSNALPSLHAVRAIGTNSLPLLLRILADEDSPAKWKLVGYAERLNVIGLSLPFDVYLKGPACLALKTLGTNASAIVPNLAMLSLRQTNGGSASSALLSSRCRRGTWPWP
jgi:hypothetical protein